MSQQKDLESEEYISKSQLKRDAHALQDLGKQLTEINNSLLVKLKLPDSLMEAIKLYKNIPNKHGAKRRQLLFIGKLMRDIDATQIQSVLEKSTQNVEHEKWKFQQLENIREELIAGNKKTFETLLSQHANLDIQHLRQLIRKSKKEQLEGKATTSSRKLFKYLREFVLQA